MRSRFGVRIRRFDNSAGRGGPWSMCRRGEERGDVPGWVLVLLMTSALVVAIWGVARERLVSIVSGALSTVCGNIGC